MNNSRKKWLVLGGMVVLIGACSLFFMRVATDKNRPAAGSSAPQSPNGLGAPDHELKALAVELEKKPAHIPILLRMAQLERDKGNLDDAAGHLRQALKSEPANLDAHLELGRVLYEKGDIGGAIAETEKVLASDPKQVDALYNLGAIYANLGNHQRARSYWMRAAGAGGESDSVRKAREALKKLGGS